MKYYLVLPLVIVINASSILFDVKDSMEKLLDFMWVDFLTLLFSSIFQSFFFL